MTAVQRHLTFPTFSRVTSRSCLCSRHAVPASDLASRDLCGACDNDLVVACQTSAARICYCAQTCFQGTEVEESSAQSGEEYVEPVRVQPEEKGPGFNT